METPLNRLAAILAATLIACRAEPAAAAQDAPKPEVRKVEAPRVLFVEHWPRWEFRFLKNAILHDETVKANILLTSSDEAFPQDKSPGQDPLTEFPANLDELLKYDVLILGDVPLENIGGDEAAKMIVDFVERGGGLILIAGAECNPHKYGRTALAPLLPVEVEAPESPSQDFEGWPYVLTDAGRAHAVTGALTAETWEGVKDGRPNLPRLRWYAPAKRLKPAAVELVQLNDLAKETKIPIFVSMTYGKGRVFYSATDETHRWRYLRGDAPYFYPLWRRAISWAAGT